jgi:NADH-quinone oxidoreductase subunit J
MTIESSLIVDVVFWIVSFVAIVSAVVVVQSKDLFKSALFLILSFFAIAALFVLLRAEFIAVVQVLIYVGAISVLIVFAILMTRDTQIANKPNKLKIPGLIIVGFILGTFFLSISGTYWVTLPENGPQNVENVFSNTTSWIGRMLLRDFVLAFEAASVLLLAAIIGALVIVRE